jgi:hypothetical protein
MLENIAASSHGFGTYQILTLVEVNMHSYNVECMHPECSLELIRTHLVGYQDSIFSPWDCKTKRAINSSVEHSHRPWPECFSFGLFFSLEQAKLAVFIDLYTNVSILYECNCGLQQRSRPCYISPLF